MANENNYPQVNVDLSEEWKAASEMSSKKENGFSEKNYLNVRLEKGEKEKRLTIRLLPMDPKGGSPFVHVHFHTVEVNEALVKPGQRPYKSYMCLNPHYNPNIDHETFGNRCPFCENNKDAYEKSLKATTPEEKKKLQELSLSFRPKEAIIVRCIERGKEEEGVKFWKFNVKYDNSDPYHKILELAKTRKEEGERAGVKIDILDLYRGRDLNLTIKQGNTENQTVIDVIESSIDTPVTPDMDQLMAWLNDKKKWQDVFTAKPYEYLSLVSEGKYPWFDSGLKKWVDKADYDARKTEEKGTAEAQSQAEVNNAMNGLTASTVTSDTQVVEDHSDEAEEDDDNLPF